MNNFFKLNVLILLYLFFANNIFAMESDKTSAEYSEPIDSTLEPEVVKQLENLVNQLKIEVSQNFNDLRYDKPIFTDANFNNPSFNNFNNNDTCYYLQNILTLKKNLFLAVGQVLIRVKNYISKTYSLYLIKGITHKDVTEVGRLIKECKQTATGFTVTYVNDFTEVLPNTYVAATDDSLGAILQMHSVCWKENKPYFLNTKSMALINKLKKSKIREVQICAQWLDSEAYYEQEIACIPSTLIALLSGTIGSQELVLVSLKYMQQQWENLINAGLSNNCSNMIDVLINDEYFLKVLNIWCKEHKLEPILKQFLPELNVSLKIYGLIIKEFLKFDSKKNSKKHIEFICKIIEQVASLLIQADKKDSILYSLLSKKIEAHKPKKIKDYKEFAQKYKKYMFVPMFGESSSSTAEKMGFELPSAEEFSKTPPEIQSVIQSDSLVEISNKQNQTSKKSERSPRSHNKSNRKKNKKRSSKTCSPKIEISRRPKDSVCIADPAIEEENLDKKSSGAENEAAKEQALEKIKYDKRIMQWFDQNSAKSQDPSSILYHTFNPIVDSLIISHGIAQSHPNQSDNQKIDTRYYMAGLLIWPDGKRQRVLFCICKDENGIVYHRGFKDKTKLEPDLFLKEFQKSEFEYDFPALSKKEIGKEEVASYDFIEAKEQAYKETEFCFYVDDPKNNVKIVLFKPA